jgi:branched-chain amino acid aminotransferase/para-aminobenzoate synthetase component 1
LWLNGAFTPLGQAAISPLDRGLLYGDGLFETLRAQEGRVLYLGEHLARLRASARALALRLPPYLGEEPDWALVLGQLLAHNRLTQAPARVKIVLTRGVDPDLGLPAAVSPTLLIMAQAYTPPTAEAYCAGWRLGTFHQASAPALARHKSLNYLFYLWARQEARQAGADEALILDQEGLVAETALGSLLCREDDRWWTPSSPSQLPGITLLNMRRLLAQDGLEVASRPARPGELRACPTVWVLNSLLGIMPVSHLDGQALAAPLPELAASYRQRLQAGCPPLGINGSVGHLPLTCLVGSRCKATDKKDGRR